MSFQRVPNTVEVRCICDWLDQEWVTTWYARCLTGYNDGDVNDVLDAVGDQFRDGFMLHLTSAVTFDRAEARDLNEEFGYSAVKEYNTAGTQTGDMMAPQAAVLTKLSGDPGGAPRQGHHFFSGVKLVVYDAATGLFDQSIVDSLVAEEENMRDAISAAGTLLDFAQVIVSRTHDKELRAEAVTNTLQGFSGRRLPASMRDRRPTVGS